MMSKEKQIEEMARKMCRNYKQNGNCASDDEPCGLECVYGYCAERIYCAGYRKQSEGEWESRSDAPGFVRCSVCKDCNVYDEWADGKKWNYCPHCGAKMKGGE